MTPAALARRTVELAQAGTPVVSVALVEATGSTPADTGARMLVTAAGLDCGTVGGGRVEAKAIGHAQAMLATGAAAETLRWSLKADVGMTCGGAVRLFFEPIGVATWPIVVFGAGHVTQALAHVLAPMPCQVTCIDPREEWLAKLPTGITKRHSPSPPEEVEKLPSDAFVLCMTRGHSSDLPVLEAIFKLPRSFPYLGVIGSKAKAAVLRKELAERGIAAERAVFRCPIGLPIGSNHPAEIAVSVAAQLLERRDALKATPVD
ncbi:MAG: xanthine dehydrogenase accessory protein XdhC [Planctomycetota bacterium]